MLQYNFCYFSPLAIQNITLKSVCLLREMKLKENYLGKEIYVKADVILRENIWFKEIYKEQTKENKNIQNYNNRRCRKWIFLDFMQYIFRNYFKRKINPEIF